MAAEHLYAHFFSPRHKGLCEVWFTIIAKTNVDRPTQRDAFGIYKLDTFAPRRLNVRDFD